jgi:hypothetical protein
VDAEATVFLGDPSDGSRRTWQHQDPNYGQFFMAADSGRVRGRTGWTSRVVFWRSGHPLRVPVA